MTDATEAERRLKETLTDLRGTYERERDDWHRRHMDLITGVDKWRTKADDLEEHNRQLLEILRAHGKHPGVSHTMESLGYDFARNAEMLACDCGHRAMGVTDEDLAAKRPDELLLGDADMHRIGAHIVASVDVDGQVADAEMGGANG